MPTCSPPGFITRTSLDVIFLLIFTLPDDLVGFLRKVIPSPPCYDACTQLKTADLFAAQNKFKFSSVKVPDCQDAKAQEYQDILVLS